MFYIKKQCKWETKMLIPVYFTLDNVTGFYIFRIQVIQFTFTNYQTLPSLKIEALRILTIKSTPISVSTGLLVLKTTLSFLPENTLTIIVTKFIHHRCSASWNALRRYLSPLLLTLISETLLVHPVKQYPTQINSFRIRTTSVCSTIRASIVLIKLEAGTTSVNVAMQSYIMLTIALYLYTCICRRST